MGGDLWESVYICGSSLAGGVAPVMEVQLLPDGANVSDYTRSRGLQPDFAALFPVAFW